MHIRQILRVLNLRYTNLYELCELAYMGTYIVARGIFVPIVLYNCIKSHNTPYMVKFMCLGLTLQSLYYITQMAGILKKKYRQWVERSNKKIAYQWLSENPKIKELTYTSKESKDNIF
jgi:hypothetical protein